jgi:hypothetical protein
MSKGRIVLAFFMIVALLAVGFIVYFGKISKPNNSQAPTSQKLLYGYFPNFDNLELTDLPAFSDVRRVFDFNGNKIVMGVHQLVEYDTKKGVFVRASSLNGPSFRSAAKIGNLLYISDNGDHFKQIQPKIYVMDLNSGLVTDTITGLMDIPYDLTNNSLHAYKNDLWIAIGDRVIKFDTVQKKVISAYTFADLGYTGKSSCGNPPEMVDEDGAVKVVEFACKKFISTYDYGTNKWTIKLMPNISPNTYIINKNATDFNLDIPQFYALTDKVNYTYYALSNKGIYSIERNTLPTIYLNNNITGLRQQSFMDTVDGKIFVIVSIDELSGPYDTKSYYDQKLVPEVLTIKTINVEAGKETDVIKNSQYNNETFGKYLSKFEPIFEARQKMTPDLYTIYSKDGSVILSINLKTDELSM